MDPPEPRQSGRKRKVNSLLFGNGMIPLEDEHRSRRKNHSNVDESLDTVTPSNASNNENSAQPRKKTASKNAEPKTQNESAVDTVGQNQDITDSRQRCVEVQVFVLSYGLV